MRWRWAPDVVGHAILSLALTAAFFLLWPTDLVLDDAAFVLRYLDNFAAGHFYCFNPSDGPMFGVSSFLHGMLSGTLAWTRLLSPENSAFASNFLGLLLLCFFTLRLLNFHLRDAVLSALALLVVVAGCPHLVISLKQGLETPLHVAVAAGAILAVTTGRRRLTWLACALAILSKLDAAPLAAVVGALAWWQAARSGERHALRREARAMLAWFVAPVALWVVAAWLVFGSPLPQSAFAKIHYHYHPKDSWFPFLSGFRDLAPLHAAGAFLLAVALGRFIEARRAPSLRFLAPLLAGVAVLVGYYFYNPGERMGWYYALPEFLLMLQIVLLAFMALPALRPWVRRGVAVLALAGLAALSLPVSARHARHMIWYLGTGEAERMALGEWVRERAAPGDTLLTAYGHVARSARLYTVDASGLNSRAATDRRLDFNRLVQDLHPQWFVKFELIYEDLQAPRGYELVRSAYNFSGIIGYPTYRVYRRTDADTLVTNTLIGKEHIESDGSVEERGGGRYVVCRGGRVRFALQPRQGRPCAVLTGIVRQDRPLDLTAEILDREGASLGQVAWRAEPRDMRDLAAGQTCEWRIPLPPRGRAASVVLTAAAPGAEGAVPVEFVEPVLLAVMPQSGHQ